MQNSCIYQALSVAAKIGRDASIGAFFQSRAQNELLRENFPNKKLRAANTEIDPPLTSQK
jgi:hypothetical protein